MSDEQQRDRINARWGALKNERSSWVDHWRDISEHLLPRSGRFFVSDRNRGDPRHNKIYDNTGTLALRVLAAGMMAGMTSPARPWFRLTTSIPELDESAEVKKWLADVTRLMQMVFAKSNTYRALHSMYEEMGTFGTASSVMQPDFQSILHHHTLTAGEYAIAASDKGRVDTLYREFQMTVAQMVGQFGKENVSPTVRGMYDQGKLDGWVTVLHAIEPRAHRDPNKRDDKNMPWRSVYLEAGQNDESPLRESGYRDFPVLSPRWAITGGDIYGNSPGMEALGDLKQLQHEQLRKAQGIDYQTKPPLQVPTSMKNRDVNTLPGGVTFVDAANPNGGIRTSWEVNLDLNYLLEDIRDVRGRIKSAFYADLFLMLANGQNPQMTATEVAERHEEKLLMIGPVLERMHNEILDPLIENTFARMVEADIVPEPPEAMQGMELNVDYVSMLAQAQRAIATNSVDRYVGNLGAIAQMKPDVLDKFDADQWVDAYSDMLGIDPDLIVPNDKVALIRKQRAEAQQQAQQQEAMAQGADTAQKLASADTEGKNALTDVTRAFSGYT
ncbi:portal protein [Guyparkeria halopsychrophila]|uniref:portal protein n=1 Tax=Guyparkeria halopsychrophila TaxID=3139421 RepID=UPI0037C51C9C